MDFINLRVIFIDLIHELFIEIRNYIFNSVVNIWNHYMITYIRNHIFLCSAIISCVIILCFSQDILFSTEDPTNSNYANLNRGAVIIDTPGTRGLRVSTKDSSIWSFLKKNVKTVDAENILREDINSFCFSGQWGEIIIKISRRPIYITKVFLKADKVLQDAQPTDISIYTSLENQSYVLHGFMQNRKMSLLGNRMNNQVKYIRLVITKNGGAPYTCVNQLIVHGNIYI